MDLTTQNITTSLADLFREQIETDPLNGLRQKALEAFISLGLPEKKTEAYKFTPVKRIIEKNIEVAKKTSNQTSPFKNFKSFKKKYKENFKNYD